MRVVTCLLTEHDLALVALAALICSVGASITVRLLLRCRESAGGSIAGWVFLGAVAAGSTIWCTHFVAMLGYRPGVPLAYDPALTALSLAIAIVAAAASFAAATLSFRGAPALAGAIFGAGIAAMHYEGMAAFTIEADILWDPVHVMASLVAAVGLAAGAFVVAIGGSAGERRQALGAAILVAAIVALHFTAMAAMQVVPFAPLEGQLTSEDAHEALAVAIAGVGLLVLGTGLASFLLDRQSVERGRMRLQHLMESSVDGAVIEQDGSIVDANSAFARLVELPRAEIVGRRLQDLTDLPGPIAEGVLAQARIVQGDEPPIPVEIIAHREGTEHARGVVVYSVRDLRQRLAQERRIAHLARNDSLTGLPNRATFLERLERAIATPSADTRIALLAIDLDRFKEVNGLHGHAAGDHVLKIVSERMRGELQDGEFLARLGGDEFVATKPIHDRFEAMEFASRLARRIGEAVAYEHADLTCGASIGIAIFPENGSSPTLLMNNADLAMYRAKSSMSESVCFFHEEMDEVVRARRKTTMELREAIGLGQLHLHYQVQASTTTGEALGYEALLRWRHPERGFVSPADFIPLAEETGLILPIGEWVLRTACDDAARWRDRCKVAVNLSALQLGDTDLPRLVRETLEASGLSPERLELEITETALMQDTARTTRILNELKALGVSIAMDDFGVGYSSLSTLRAFPFDKIKLDKSFMREIDDSAQARAIIRAVLALGESLAIPVLAEGVETEAQLGFLRQQGCAAAQGFLLGRPSPRSIQPAPVGGQFKTSSPVPPRSQHVDPDLTHA